MAQDIEFQNNTQNQVRRSVKLLNPEVARKIAAGEVIDRPNAIVRELMDNAVDSGASLIRVEITGGGIEKIRIIDNGCGMSKSDLETCARPHATSKISSEEDLLHLSTLGFRGEALSSMAAVSRLEIKSSGWKMNASVTEDHILTPDSISTGTVVQTSGLFENFPARRMFLKRPASEGTMCRTTFEEKVLPRPDISFTFTSDGEEKLNLPATNSLLKRFVQTMEFFENEELFYQVTASSPKGSWSFNLVIGEPSVSRSSRKDIYIFVNGRKIQEYSLVQAIEYGATGFFPNGSHPVACLFVQMDPSLVDFNIHPAKREARFKDISDLHHGVSTATRDFFKNYTVKNIIQNPDQEEKPEVKNSEFDFSAMAALALSSDEKETGIATSHLKSPSAISYSSVKRTEFSNSSPWEKERYTSGPSDSSSDARSKFFPKKAEIKTEIKSEHSWNHDYSSKPVPASFSTNDEPEDSTEKMPDEVPSTESLQNFKENYIKSESEKLNGFHFVGMALGTFLIAEKHDTLYIIDQHAAHERYLYNQIVAEQGQKQTLLVPYVIQTENTADDNYIEAIKDSLEKSGFTATNAGNGRWEFSTVPVRWKGSEKDLARDILDRRINPGDMINAFAASAACRQAVMDGTVLDSAMAEQIASWALELPDPHCPHGRPVFTKITRSQLFALVKRT